MNFNEYQKAAESVAVYPDKGNNIIYPALGLCGETGELIEKYKKVLRDSNGVVDDDSRTLIKKEIGDILWYISQCCREIGADMSMIKSTFDLDSVYMSTKVNIVDELFTLQLRVTNFCVPLRTGNLYNIQRKTEMLTSLSFCLQSLRDICFFFDCELHDIALLNIEKLNKRKENNTLHGSGDNR